MGFNLTDKIVGVQFCHLALVETRKGVSHPNRDGLENIVVQYLRDSIGEQRRSNLRMYVIVFSCGCKNNGKKINVENSFSIIIN